MSTCIHCHKEAEGGCYTNGDGYGDGKHVGLEAGPHLFFCWDCIEHTPEHGPKIDDLFAANGMCGFLEAWIGRCRNPKPCDKHQSQKCWKCGGPAVRNCDHTSALVCGMPECKDHPHHEVHA